MCALLSFTRLFVFHRNEQQRFEIIAFFPTPLVFFPDPAMSARDDVSAS
jgi:hypothetical protein